MGGRTVRQCLGDLIFECLMLFAQVPQCVLRLSRFSPLCFIRSQHLSVRWIETNRTALKSAYVLHPRLEGGGTKWCHRRPGLKVLFRDNGFDEAREEQGSCSNHAVAFFPQLVDRFCICQRSRHARGTGDLVPKSILVYSLSKFFSLLKTAGPFSPKAFPKFLAVTRGGVCATVCFSCLPDARHGRNGPSHGKCRKREEAYHDQKVPVAAAVVLGLATGSAFAQQKTVKIGFTVSTFTPVPSATNRRQCSSNSRLTISAASLADFRSRSFTRGDDQKKPDIGVQKTKGLYVDFVVGYIWSNVSLASLKPLVDSKTMTVITNAGASQVSGELCSPYVFSTSWKDDCKRPKRWACT